MSDSLGDTRFLIFVAVSWLVFTGILKLVLRRRTGRRVPWPRIVGVAIAVVVGGMLFARWGAQYGLPWWVYYPVPASLTVLLPPLAFRMRRGEAGLYLLLAVLMAPAIHAAFSFLLGWNEYMPFWAIPPWWELFK